MKKILAIIVLAALPVLLNAQDLIDGLIDKYQGQEGFTTVVINSAMFDIAAAIDDDNDLQKMKGMIDKIRIIAMDDFSNTEINFFSEIQSQVNAKSYVELMTVKEKDNDVVFYIKYAGKDIEELLLIAGGTDENAIISIKGKIDLKELASISKSVHISGFEYLDNLENN
jgi:phosphotransferase system HPr-like phosphotransfer protein